MTYNESNISKWHGELLKLIFKEKKNNACLIASQSDEPKTSSQQNSNCDERIFERYDRILTDDDITFVRNSLLRFQMGSTVKLLRISWVMRSGICSNSSKIHQVYVDKTQFLVILWLICFQNSIHSNFSDQNSNRPQKFCSNLFIFISHEILLLC